MVLFNEFMQSMYEMAQSDKYRKLCQRAKSSLNEMARNPSMSVQQLLHQVMDVVVTDPDIDDAVKQPLLHACQNTIAWMNGPERDPHARNQGPGRTIADGPNWKGKGSERIWQDGGSHDVHADVARQKRSLQGPGENIADGPNWRRKGI